MQMELAAERRTVRGRRVKQLRRQGVVPGVMYGHRFDALPIQFEERSLRRLLSQVGGSQLIAITLQGQDVPEMALVRDVQRDAITGAPLHVDFYRVNMRERLTAEVPLTIIGDSPVVESREGMLLQGISYIEVECLPGDLVDAIEVDVSQLTEVDMGVYVRDLIAPEGIDILTDPDEMILRIVHVAEEEEEIEEEGLLPGVGEVEVITAAAAQEPAESEG